MDATGIAVVSSGGVAFLAFLSRVLWSLHKIISKFEHLLDRVGGLERTLANGISADIRLAAERSGRAEKLAGVAATTAANAEQKADEGRATIERAVNALRAEVNAMTEAGLTDHANIWRALAEAGFDRRET